MTQTNIKWTPLPNWQTVNLVGFNQPGLIRFSWNGKVVFLAYAASPETGVGARIGAYRRGGTGTQTAGQRIKRYQNELDLEYCFLDLPRAEIRALGKRMIESEQPAWNTPNGYPGRI